MKMSGAVPEASRVASVETYVFGFSNSTCTWTFGWAFWKRFTSGWLIASVSQLRKLIVPVTPLPEPFPEAVPLGAEHAETSDDEATAARAAPALPRAIKRRRDTPALPDASWTGLRLDGDGLFMTVTP